MTKKNTPSETPQELEFKFESLSNTQIKLVPLETNESMIEKVRTLCKILQIDFGNTINVVINDEYFDSKGLLRRNGISFRRRIEGTRHLVTFKAKTGESAEGEMRRLEDEFELSSADFAVFLKNTARIADNIREKFGTTISIGSKLENVMTLRNERTVIPLATGMANYKFCFDKFYYYFPVEGKYSEYQAEVELELESGDLPNDPQLDHLRLAIKQILGYVPTQKSKLERGLDRLSAISDDILPVHAIAMSILDFSLRSPETQKQVIQRLNRSAKKAIRNARGTENDDNIIFLPAGDGMTMLFNDRPELLIPIVFDIQASVKAENRLYKDSKFTFRTGMHSGPVFKYSDVNENNNFAGDGINLARRVMDLGSDWHILTTRAAYDAFEIVRQENPEWFTNIGQFHTSDDESMVVFNTVCSGRDAGSVNQLLRP